MVLNLWETLISLQLVLGLVHWDALTARCKWLVRWCSPLIVVGSWVSTCKSIWTCEHITLIGECKGTASVLSLFSKRSKLVLGISFIWCLVGYHTFEVLGRLCHVGLGLRELDTSGWGGMIVCAALSLVVLIGAFGILDVKFELVDRYLEHIFHFWGLSR